MTRAADLDHWERYPHNVTADQMLAEAKRPGWVVRRQSGDHVVLMLDGFQSMLVIDLGTKASPTKRSMIRILQEGKSNA